ncbi:unnamed protein product [Protopolystoma xenopodis]|uniref:Sof1-like protein domain-containing protein n=1 Tax=Protopolystoma xenopodis TaxID=117903 RepID=A0A448WJ99_9PLAT|nr:unnamed protein product [Protopolystoma xenopodis]
MLPRQRASLNEAIALRSKFSEHPEVRKILKRHHLPKSILQATKEKKETRAKERRKERNLRVFTKLDIPYVKEREKHTIGQFK